MSGNLITSVIYIYIYIYYTNRKALLGKMIQISKQLFWC